jgi:hypothetical protein
MNLRKQKTDRRLWIGLGIGAVLMASMTLLMHIDSIRHHIPIYYGAEPYAQNPLTDTVCRP